MSNWTFSDENFVITLHSFNKFSHKAQRTDVVKFMVKNGIGEKTLDL